MDKPEFEPRGQSVTEALSSAELASLARKLAKATGEDVATAVLRAVEERLARVPKEQSAKQSADDIEPIFERLAGLAILDGRSAEEILNYDDNGIPR